ncbi:hypothetical protein DPMN_010801 [Dreissena polymorpha]|uniref:Uncharacterized protein n=1 Tax=Dreissena polymorpha TaxID=45954 RepID=A0A9D4MZD6_DREPO|nr:hypothetical protein DPMN_010801 [Dreissena polymorpha]
MSFSSLWLLVLQEILTPGRRKSSLVPLSAQARVLLLCDQTEPITFRDALPGK